MKHTYTPTPRNFSNGASTHIIVVPDSPVVEAKIVFDVGNLMFEANKHHLPHILEHLLLGPSKRFPDEPALVKYLQRLGANVNAHTSFEELAVTLHAPAESFAEAFQAVWDSVFGAAIKPAQVSREKPIIEREIYERFDSVTDSLTAIMLSEIIPQMPATVDAHIAGLADITDIEVAHAYEQFIQPQGTKIIIAGNIDKITIENINKLAQSLKARSRQLIATNKPHIEVHRHVVGEGFSNSDNPNGLLYMYFVSHTQHERRKKSIKNIASGLLFDTPTATIPASLRDKGLIYSWDTDLLALDDVEIYMLSITSNVADLPEVAAEVVKLLSANVKQPIDEEAFETTRSFMRHIVPTLQETSAEILAWYEGAITRDLPTTDLDDELKYVKEATAGEVQDAIRHIFLGGDIYFSLVGDDKTSLWATDFRNIVNQLKDSTISHAAIERSIATFRQKATEKLRIVQHEHNLFFAVYPLIMWVGLLLALRVRYLPYAHNPRATVSMFDAMYDKHYWVWGASLFVTLFVALLLFNLKTTARRRLIASSLCMVSALAYLYGCFAIFGDTGKASQPYWQDAVSLYHPAVFLLLTPVAFYWSIQYYRAVRRN